MGIEGRVDVDGLAGVDGIEEACLDSVFKLSGGPFFGAEQSSLLILAGSALTDADVRASDQNGELVSCLDEDGIGAKFIAVGAENRTHVGQGMATSRWCGPGRLTSRGFFL